MTSIGSSAFYGCSSLTAITCWAMTPPNLGDSSTFGEVDKSIPVYVHATSADAYKAAEVWNEFSNIQDIPSTYIASGTYGDNFTWRITGNKELIIEGTGVVYGYDSAPWWQYREMITTVTLSEGVTSIEYQAFKDCSSLTAINIPEGVTSIGGYAFEGCRSLTAINIPESVTYIGNYAFKGCSNLTDIVVAEGNTTYDSRNGCNAIIETNSNALIQGCATTIIPESVTSIEYYAFYDCYGLTAINIPEGVTSIGGYAFEGCRSLTDIDIPENSQLTSIGEYAFSSCSSLTTITIPKSVTKIEYRVFWNCSSLTSITIPEGVTSIGEWAFKECSSLTDITIPSSVTSIGDYAFSGCTSLTSVLIPKSVTSIESGVFSCCSSLTSITIPEGVTSIGDYAFASCSSLTTITIPEGVTSIGDRAICDCSSLSYIYCNAESVPATGDFVFSNYDATLYVPQSAIASYQSTAPWSNFTIKKLVPGIGVTSLSDLSNDKVYTLRSERAFLLYCEAEGVADKLCTSTGKSVGTVEYALGNPALHFRIEKQGDNYYLYSVGAGKYVDANGRYEAQANTVLTMEIVGGNYPWKLCLGGNGMNTQIPGQANEGIMVNWWTTTDEGNCFQIVEAVPPVITLNKYVATLTETNTMTLTATVEPDDIAHETVTWSSSNPSVATVDAMGVVTAVTPGTATITASLYGVTAQCEVTVTSIGKIEIDGIWYNLVPEAKQAEVTSPDGTKYSGSITIPATVTHNGEEYSVTSIGESAFAWCFSLTDITIPESVTSIGNQAFHNCSSLTDIHISSLEAWCNIDFSSSDANPLCYADNLYINGELVTELAIPNSVTAIKDYAFSYCSSLTAITIPESVTSIGSYAFYGCSSLTAITLPKSVDYIGSNAFANCPELTDVYCYAESVPSTEAGVFDDSYPEYATLHVPASAVDEYKTTAPWSSFGKIIALGASITEITLSESSATLTEGEDLTLTMTTNPEDADRNLISWSSSNPSVATVDNTGKVTAIALGTATITATANDGSGVSASCEVTVTPASYVITFLIDGEQFYTQTLTRGSTITLPEAPTKEGHTFSGWGEVPETMPANDVVIEGTFIANKYHVTFKIGDEVIAANTLEYGTAIVAPDAPEKEGHRFNGWGDVAETVPASDVTYEGSYSINSYTLTYVVDGEVVLTLPILYGGSIPSLKEPTKEGYTFSGWSEIPETMPANDVTIEGIFTQLPSVFLTINQADNGYVKQQLTEGTVCTFTIVAAEGWKIHSVTFNGEEVTDQLTEEGTFTTPALSEDAVLNIAYEQEVPESVENAQASRIKVQGHHGTLRITGATEGAAISVYTTDGTLVAQESTEGSETQLTLPTNQVYLVKVADTVVKIGM